MNYSKSTTESINFGKNITKKPYLIDTCSLSKSDISNCENISLLSNKEV